MDDHRSVWRKLIETLRPDLDHYRKTPRLAKVLAVKKGLDLRLNKATWKADLQILMNDGSVDPSEPAALQDVTLATAAFVPEAGTLVAVDFLRGDPGVAVVVGILGVGQANLKEVNVKASSGKTLTLNEHGAFLGGSLSVYGDVGASGNVFDGGQNTNHHSHP